MTRTSSRLRAACWVLALLLPLLLLLASGLVSGSRFRLSATIEHASQVDLALARLVRPLVEAESGLRGYLATGDRALLATYERGRSQWQASFDSAAPLLDEPGQRTRMTHVNDLARQKLELLEETRLAFERGARDQALASQLSRGADLMDEIHAEVDALQRDEARHEASQQRDRAKRTIWAVSLFASAVVTLALVAVSVTVRYRMLEREASLVRQLASAKGELEAELEAMRRLHNISSSFLPADNPLEPVLTEIVDAAIAISGADFGNIQVLDPASSDLRIVAQRGFPAWYVEFWDRVSAGHGTCGTALERGERVVVEDVEKSPIFVGTPALAIQQKAGVRAVQSTPLRSRSGKPVGMFSTHFKARHRPDDRALRRLDLLGRLAADLIDRAQVEEERARLAGELAVTLKFAEQFIGIVSHDLRNPLSAIGLVADSMKRKERCTEDIRAIERIQGSAGRMNNMVSQLLDLTRARLAGGIVIEPQAINLAAVAERAVDELQMAHAAREIRCNLPADARGYGDPHRLAQVVSNLVGNAVEHGDPGRPIDVRLVVLGESVELEVHSFGPPIPSELLPLIFDPYRRGAAHACQTSGLGLGLFISKQIVLAHGGNLDVRSSVEEGTMFTVILPRSRAAGAATPVDERPIKQRPGLSPGGC